MISGRRILVVAGCAVALVGCTLGGGQSRPNIGWAPPHESQPALSASYEYPAQVFADEFQDYSSVGEGASGLSVELSEVGGAVVVIATRTGLLDDSVEGTQERVVLELRDDQRWYVRERGFRYRCWRGGRPMRWTIELCP
jgi:hypothetical protein